MLRSVASVPGAFQGWNAVAISHARRGAAPHVSVPIVPIVPDTPYVPSFDKCLLKQVYFVVQLNSDVPQGGSSRAE